MATQRRILILDDETKVAFFLQESLEALGHDLEIISVSSSEEALKQASQQRFDLLVTDQRVPNMNGLELIEQIQEIHPDTRFILITAYGSDDLLAEAQRLGAYRYFIKPFHIEDFVQAVVEVLENNNGHPEATTVNRQADALRDRLEELRREVGAQCVVASTADGKLVAQAGTSVDLDLEQLLELVADDFETSLAIARHLKGTQNGNLTYFEGANHDIYISGVQEDLFLVILFDRRIQASRIGIVWLYARRAIESLRRVRSHPLEMRFD